MHPSVQVYVVHYQWGFLLLVKVITMNHKEKMQDMEMKSKYMHKMLDRIEKRMHDLIYENHHLKKENIKLKEEKKALELEVEKLNKIVYGRKMS